MSVEDWNSLPTNDREVRLQATLDAMILAAAPATTEGDEGNGEGTSEGAGSGDSDGGGDGDDDKGPGVSGVGLAAGDEGTKTPPAPPAPPVDETPKEETPAEDIQAVREEYHTAVGRRAYAGWDIPTLKEKIAEFEKSKA